ncbi:MAG TPA: hypothetical protein VJN71_09590 [Nitrososphaerales archaeon]|nr:hypothetical protein [Nitrososphaerales archaeon]
MAKNFRTALIAGAIVALLVVSGVSLLPKLNKMVYHTNVGTTGTEIAQLCPALFGFATFIGYGFTESNNRQFLMAPGSTAYVNITYNTLTQPASEIFNKSTSYFQRLVQLYQLNGSGQPLRVNSSTVGISVYPINVTILSNTYLAAIYVISSSTSSPRDTYLLPFWSVCPLPLLTIGDTMYSGPYASNQTFY